MPIATLKKIDSNCLRNVDPDFKIKVDVHKSKEGNDCFSTTPAQLRLAGAKGWKSYVGKVVPGKVLVHSSALVFH